MEELLVGFDFGVEKELVGFKSIGIQVGTTSNEDLCNGSEEGGCGGDESGKGGNKGQFFDKSHNYTSFLKGLYHAAGKRTSRCPAEERVREEEKMDNESKKPCAPVEEESRDYNELGLYLHGKTMQTAMELWEMLPGWMEARRMALVDPAYNRKMSAMVADLAGTVQKAAQEMAEWGQEE